MADVDLLAALRAHFNYPAFRPGQEEALRHVTAGRNTLVVMPTGSGKSLIYQLGGLLAPGTAIVFSPLIALMKDQVDAMRKRGIAATFINSTVSPAETSLRLNGLAAGEYKLVLIAPERLRSQRFQEVLRRIDISMLVIDEAHCLSQWGHDFRPDYLHIARLRQSLGGKHATVALTATATPRTRDSILELLGIPDAECVITGFNRPNILFDVRFAPSKRDKLIQIEQLLRGPLAPGDAGGGIIYANTRADTEEVAAFVRERLGIPSLHYHGALPATQRNDVQDQFMSGDLPVVVATNAFGMGIDRPDVRFVLHHAMPASLEAYYQEAGRAGRDGLPARALLLHAAQDASLQEFLINNSIPNAAELESVWRVLQQGDETNLETMMQRTGLKDIKARVAIETLASAGEAVDARVLAQLSRRAEQRRAHRRALLGIMRQYAEAETCRRRMLLDYFGDRGAADAPVCCDICEAEAAPEAPGATRAATTREERAALIVLDTIAGFNAREFSVGKGKLAQILKGSASSDTTHFQRNRNFGKFSTLRLADIEGLIAQLMSAGYLKQIGERPVLHLTSRGESALEARAAIDIEFAGKSRARMEIKQRERASTARTAGGTIQTTLAMLREGRSVEQIAAERALTIGTIFSHCSDLILNGQLNAAEVMPHARIERIMLAIAEIGTANALTPIKNKLPPDYDFSEIRCVANEWKRENGG
jgi:ATP-dependent DNA helicase RecQ